jgi:hypothetical protein
MDIEEDELYHHGVKGMKWGVRKSRGSSGTSSRKSRAAKKTKSYFAKRKAAKKKRIKEEQVKKEAEQARKKRVSELSDKELQDRIARLQLEKTYKDLVKSTQPQASSGKKFVTGVLEASGKNVAAQLTTYVMGRAVNKALEGVFNDKQVVNPKKGQKDK